jgi:SAM-dependent methyltransferase
MDFTKFEEKHVTQVYNIIAKPFSITRKNPWPQVVNFINEFPENSLIGDIGCGNGRFMLTRKDCLFEGCDRTQGMVDICLGQKLKVKQGNITNIPFPDEYFDGIVCIAVLHHLADIERRKLAIKELIRILKPEGKLLIEVWSYEASIGSKFRFQTIDDPAFNEQDKFLSWKNPNETKDTGDRNRYYHLFTKDEIIELVLENKNVEILDCYLDHGNWFITLKKLE